MNRDLARALAILEAQPPATYRQRLIYFIKPRVRTTHRLNNCEKYRKSFKKCSACQASPEPGPYKLYLDNNMENPK